MSVQNQSQNTAIINSNAAESNAEEFLDNLVKGIVGYSIEEIPIENRAEIITKCVDTFSNYIIEYVKIKYGEKDAIRLEASQKFAGSDIFVKFTELGSKFDEAYNAFLNQLEISWKAA